MRGSPSHVPADVPTRQRHRRVGASPYVELDQRGGLDVGRVPGASGLGSQDDEQGTQALSAATDDVVPDLVDERDVAAELLSDFGVDRGQVAGDEGSYVVELHGIPASPQGKGIVAAFGLPGNAELGCLD